MKLEEILSKTSNKISVKRHNSGVIEVLKSGVIGTNPFSLKKFEVEVPFYVVSHREEGNFLIDTGLDKSFQSEQYGSLKGLLIKRIVLGKGWQRTEQNVESILKRTPIKAVFLTHSHYDHAAGLLNIPSETPVYMCKKENIMGAYKKYFKKLADKQGLPLTNQRYIEEVGHVYDVFGDNSFLFFKTPGHTEGHVSYLINSSERPILICGDAYFCDLEELKQKGVGWFSNKTKGNETLKKLMDVETKYHSQIELWYGHSLVKTPPEIKEPIIFENEVDDKK